MAQTDKAKRFTELHQENQPLVLYNIWDARSARAVTEAGAAAVATGSWSVAGAHGYSDGQQIPLDHVLTIVERICDSVDVPVSIDFEGGYAESPAAIAEHASRLIAAGAIGVNFEDRIVGGDGLHSIPDHCKRIEALRAASVDAGVDLFINARTDVFLQADNGDHGSLTGEAEARAAAYAAAGASGFFAPGLTDEGLIQRLCESVSMPVNIMMMHSVPNIDRLAAIGVSRVSFGPQPFLLAYEFVQKQAEELYAGR